MKKIFVSISVLFYILLLVTSCKKEENVANGAADFVGDYRTSDACSNTANSTYIITIKENPSNADQILLYNFYNCGNTKYITADINGNSITIFTQAYTSTTVSGSGMLSGGNIDLSYEVDDGSGILDSCSASLNHI